MTKFHKTRIIHFHFDTRENLGDAAVVYAIRDMIQENFSEYEYKSIPIKYLVKLKLDEESSENISYEYGAMTIIRKWGRTSYKIIKKRIIRFLKKIRGTDDESILRLINSYDIIIVGGGGLYSRWTLPFNTTLIDKIRIPLAIIGAGYNLNLGDKQFSVGDLSSIKLLNQKAKLRSVRDLVTQNFLAELGIKSTLIGDPALSLIPCETTKVFRKVLNIGINIAYHNWSLQGRYTNGIIDTYVKVLKRLQLKYDLDIYYLKHSVHEDYIVKKLQKRFPNLIVCDCSVQELKSIYAHLNLVISMMLHSAILAYSTGTKFINIAYDQKNHSFMELIDKTSNIIPVKVLDEDLLYTKSLEVIANPSIYSPNKSSLYFVNKQRIFIKKIVKLDRSK